MEEEETNAINALARFSGKEELLRLWATEGGAEAIDTMAKLYPIGQVSSTEGAPTKTEQQEQKVCERVLMDNEFVRVKELRDKGLYYKGACSHLYRQLTDDKRDKLIQEAFRGFYRRKPSADKTKRFGETLTSWVEEERERINNGIIMVKENLYWDYNKQDLVGGPSGDNPCFRRLFDHKETDEIKIDPTKLDGEKIKRVFKETYSHLEKTGGRIDVETVKEDCPELDISRQPLNAFWLWGNNEEDTMNDILMALSCNFMRVKPKGAFILIGRTRNGKSSFIMLLHTQFGHNNTAEVALADLNDPHLNMDLLGALVNAPDEEEEGRGADILRAQGRFKKLATHKALSLQVYYSQNPQDVATDFMSYHAMNDVPEWQGTGAEACMKRSLIIMFEHDFSRQDNNGREFEKETYTEEFFSVLLGVEFAFAKYYDSRGFSFSRRQQAKKKLVAEEVDNMSVYLDSFLLYYPDGYQTASVVHEDYKLWCEAKGLRWSPFKEFNKKLKARGGYPSKIVTEAGDNIHIVRLGKGGKIFHRDAKVKEFGGRTVEYMITDALGMGYKHQHKAQSVIDQLEIRTMNNDLKGMTSATGDERWT